MAKYIVVNIQMKPICLDYCWYLLGMA